MTDRPDSPPAALSHLRVLDLTRVLAGPWATQTLADMGAEVIKIERPDGGNDTRGWGPPFLRDAGTARPCRGIPSPPRAASSAFNPCSVNCAVRKSADSVRR